MVELSSGSSCGELADVGSNEPLAVYGLEARLWANCGSDAESLFFLRPANLKPALLDNYDFKQQKEKRKETERLPGASTQKGRDVPLSPTAAPSTGSHYR